MKELVEAIARALVDNESEVDVNEISGTNTVTLELRVAKSDIGKVIGKQGRTAEAIRSILSAHGAKVRRKTHLEIIEPGKYDRV